MPPDEPEDPRAELARPWPLIVALGLDHGAVRDGQGAKVHCPWCHGGRHQPPCAIQPRDGGLRAHCFACGAGGDVVALVARVLGLSPDHDPMDGPLAAVARAARSAPPAPAAPAPRGKPALDASAWSRGARGLLELCPLEGSAAAGLAFWGILDEARADGWGELPGGQARQGAERSLDEAAGFDVDEAGLDELASALVERSLRSFVPWLWDRAGAPLKPLHRLLIPWRNPAGQIWNVQRRWAPALGDERPPPGEPRYVEPLGTASSPASPHVYGVDAPGLAGASEVWLVAGAHDALALRALNRRGLLHRDRTPRPMAALGLPGAGSWPRLQATVAPLLAGRRVVLALAPGQASAAQAAAVEASCRSAGAAGFLQKAPPDGARRWTDVSARLWRTDKR